MDFALLLVLVAAAFAFFLQIEWLYITIAILFATMLVVRVGKPTSAKASVSSQRASPPSFYNQPVVVSQQPKMNWLEQFISNIVTESVIKGGDLLAEGKKKQVQESVKQSNMQYYVNIAVQMKKSGKTNSQIESALKAMGASDSECKKAIELAQKIV